MVFKISKQRQSRLQFQTKHCVKLTVNKQVTGTVRPWCNGGFPAAWGRQERGSRTYAAARPECLVLKTKISVTLIENNCWKVQKINGPGSPQLRSIKLCLQRTKGYHRMKLCLHLLYYIPILYKNI